MFRFFLALVAVVGTAAPASALSFQIDFPTLTYPPQPSTHVSQGCADLTSLNGATCTPQSK